MKAICEGCIYNINSSEGSLGFGCGNDYCVHECLMFDCLAEENAQSHYLQAIDELEHTTRQELAEIMQEIGAERAEEETTSKLSSEEENS